MAKIELTVSSGKKVICPCVEEGVTLALERRAVPGKLCFTAVDDAACSIEEGDAVFLRVDGAGIFAGFVFSRRMNKDGLVSVVAYDQLRYLKNKDTMVYEGKKASELLRLIAGAYQLQVGTVEDTGWVIALRQEENQTLADILLTALELTLQNTGKMFYLYDDFGKLCLRGAAGMRLNLMLDEEGAEDYEYQSSIDGETYNQVKLVREDKSAGGREMVLIKDGENVKKWGVLQLFDSYGEQENGQAKAAELLKLYNAPVKNLSVSGVFGDARVRAGSQLSVRLVAGGERVSGYMMADKVLHRFENGLHTMDLQLRGGGFTV